MAGTVAGLKAADGRHSSVAVRDYAAFDRNAFVAFLEGRRIATRLLFGSNLVLQHAHRGLSFRIAGELRRADQVMHGTLWVACYRGFTTDWLDRAADTVRAFCLGGARA